MSKPRGNIFSFAEFLVRLELSPSRRRDTALSSGKEADREVHMIGGMHTIFYSKDPDAVRSFFRDVLEFRSVDAGHGWLIFAAPPSELAVHPTETNAHPEVYLMTADLDKTAKALQKKGVEFSEPISEQRWGRLTHFKLPDGQSLGLYEPHHPMAIRMGAAKSAPGKKPKARKPARQRGKS